MSVVTDEVRRETMRMIKEAVYELEIGPAEILKTRRVPESLCIKFENQKGGEEHVFVPVPSEYTWICSAIRQAFERR